MADADHADDMTDVFSELKKLFPTGNKRSRRQNIKKTGTRKSSSASTSNTITTRLADKAVSISLASLHINIANKDKFYYANMQF